MKNSEGVYVKELPSARGGKTTFVGVIAVKEEMMAQSGATVNYILDSRLNSSFILQLKWDT